MTDNRQVNPKIELYFQNILNKSQRIFTSLDRDPDSPTFGCFDRDYWHYKIRDFSSMILHQASLTLDTLYHWNYEKNIYCDKPVLKEWIEASLNHWCGEQSKSGSFNEYYPFEEGYPPTAFSLYATALLVLEKGYENQKILSFIEKTCQWILNNPEREASNQEAIGISAVYLASKIPNVKVETEKLEIRLQEFFSSQDAEGWFPEYHGPDIGYLSVTIDALWDYYRYSDDQRAFDAMTKAVKFIALFITDSGNLPVMINSRNTDYIVPYGIVNYTLENRKLLPVTFALLKKITDPFNYLETTDDRYLCHYVYTSSTRAVDALEKLKDLQSEYQRLELNNAYDLQSSGIVIKKISRYTLYLNTKKGGIIYLYDHTGLIYTNHGYRYVSDGLIAVSHWLTENNQIQIDKNENQTTITIHGQMVSRKWLIPTPLKHTALRVISYTFGRKVIPLLKKIFIFGDKKLPMDFSRHINLCENKIKINDTIKIDEDSKYDIHNIKISPYYSLRHVSSAVRFTPDELLWNNEKFKPEISKEKNSISYVILIGLK